MSPTSPNNVSLSSRVRVRFAVAGLAGLLAAAAIGCGRPFNIKTQPAGPLQEYAATASLDSIIVKAHAITDEDLLYDTFDANLISAGVLPVRVKLTNSGNETVDCKDARFEIETQSGRFKSVDARKVFKRLISYYGVSVYTKAGYSESLEALTSYALDFGTPLAGAQVREGLMFFLMPAEAARRTGLTLVIGKLGSKRSDGHVALKLN